MHYIFYFLKDLSIFNSSFEGAVGRLEDTEGGLRSGEDALERGRQVGVANSREDVRKSTLSSGERSRRNATEGRSLHAAGRRNCRSEGSGQRAIFFSWIRHYLSQQMCYDYVQNTHMLMILNFETLNSLKSSQE